MQFPWWLVVIAGMAGAISSLALHLDGQGSQKHEAGLMAATSRLVRAVPYLFYVPAPAQREADHRLAQPRRRGGP